MVQIKRDLNVLDVHLVNIPNLMDLDVKIVELDLFQKKELKNVLNVQKEKEEMKKEINVLIVKLVIILLKKEVVV